jgi:hypothetical protein
MTTPPMGPAVHARTDKAIWVEIPSVGVPAILLQPVAVEAVRQEPTESVNRAAPAVALACSIRSPGRTRGIAAAEVAVFIK